MRAYTLAAAVSLVVAVSGCSKENKSTGLVDPAPQEKEQALFQMQLQQLEQAKGVEETLKLDAKELDQSIDKQTDGSY
jgi:hypothetical protein